MNKTETEENNPEIMEMPGLEVAARFPQSFEAAMENTMKELDLLETPDDKLNDEQRKRKAEIISERKNRKENYERKMLAKQKEDAETNVKRRQYFNDISKCCEMTLEAFEAQLAKSRSKKILPGTYGRDMIAACLLKSYVAEVNARNYAFTDTETIKDLVFIVTEWLFSSRKCGLIFSGNVGCGKTTMVRAMQQTFRILKLGWIDIVNASVIGNDCMRDLSKVEIYGNIPILCIDDLGTEPTSVQNYGNTINAISEIISIRYDKQRPTIITTNLHYERNRDEVTLKYGLRTSDRINEMCARVWIKKEGSYRV